MFWGVVLKGFRLYFRALYRDVVVKGFGSRVEVFGGLGV